MNATTDPAELRRLRNKRYYERNKEKEIARKLEWKKNNPEKVSANFKRWRTNNPEKHAENVRRWCEANPERAKENARRRLLRFRLKQYGLTVEDYERMVAEQGNACAICRSFEIGRKGRTWLVDHDHQTGKVRGLLCHPCNAAIGFARDSTELLGRMIEYLER
jgi:Recombination endonuclease VII.